MSHRIKVLLIWGLLVGLVIVALLERQSKDAPTVGISAEAAAARVSAEAPTPGISADAALKLIDAGSVSEYRSYPEGLVLETSDGKSLLVAAPAPEVWRRLGEKNIPFAGGGETLGPTTSDTTSDTTGILVFILLIAGVVFALLYFLRKMRGAGGTSLHNIFELRKSKARPVEQADKAHFADIGGNAQAVELLADIVDFLRSPERWTAAGLRVPRGVLLVGPPGTGKTLLARAVAGETQSAFFYTSASEFVEMFIGVGAARVRDTFEKAVAKQPAVIFIDELDAIGRRRGSGAGIMHEEREGTLNQLLVLLDGMERHAKLVVMAATNRPDVLDPALLRSGRFDRVLRLELPTANDRLDILKIHTRNKPLDSGISLESIAARTDNFSGADLEALTNAAGLLAVRRTRSRATDGRNETNGAIEPVSLTNDDFDRALVDMTKAARQFDQLDTMLVESVSQFAEPVGRAVARVTLMSGATVEGDVLWMNATHIKLRLANGSETIVAKDASAQIVPLTGTEPTAPADFIPDRWAGRTVDAS